MATQTTAGPSSSLSNLSLSQYSRTNHIDLTLEDEESASNTFSPGRRSKRHCIEDSASPDSFSSGIFPARKASQSTVSPTSSNGSINHARPAQLAPPDQISSPHLQVKSPTNLQSTVTPPPYRPPFAGPSSSAAFFGPQRQRHMSNPSHPPPPTSHSINSHKPAPSDRQVIDLTGSPSPPPSGHQDQPTPTPLPSDLPPKTPVCIGQLLVTALVLYPVPYLLPQEPGSHEAEWATVRLQYEHSPNKPGGSETIHIKAPHGRTSSGEVIAGEGFGVVEQKVATSLGPMLGKGLIRLDAKVRKGQPNVSAFSLR